MAITSEPKGPKPFLPGLVKHDIMMSVNPGYTYYAHCILHTKWSDNVNHSQADLDTLWKKLDELAVKLVLLGGTGFGTSF